MALFSKNGEIENLDIEEEIDEKTNKSDAMTENIINNDISNNERISEQEEDLIHLMSESGGKNY